MRGDPDADLRQPHRDLSAIALRPGGRCGKETAARTAISTATPTKAGRAGIFRINRGILPSVVMYLLEVSPVA